MQYMDVTGGGPQQPAWHALQALMFEESLLLVDPQIGALPYLDWGAMGAAEYDARFGTARGTPIASFSGGGVEAGGVFGAVEGVFVVDKGPFALWPVPQFDWRTWYVAQPQEVRVFFEEAALYWDSEELWEAALSGLALGEGAAPADRPTSAEAVTTEALLAFSNGQMRHTNLPAPFPYLLRGHTGADFWRIMSGLDWARPAQRDGRLPRGEPREHPARAAE